MEYEHGAKNQPMDGNPSMRGPSESATHVARADFPHLSGPEWEALQRLATVIGEAAVATMLQTLSPTEQHGVALGFIVKEQRDAAVAMTTTASSRTTPRAVIETAREQLCGKRRGTSSPMACRGRHCHCSSTHLRRSVEGCVRHVMSWRTSEELVVRTLRASARTRSSRRSSDKRLILLRTSSGRGLSSSTCSKASMTFMLTPNVRGTWS
ncbi:hypothetical protein PC116_g21661 [Phytophthora cactorum]|nr:hypothetical protein Pcac1_g15739 [Phytophthora cactorum]KAG4230031.1 hypothetical protein PC116_g21661 [Phytophthora cactorum]